MARILIVDDSRTSRRMLKEILGEMGHEVVDEAVNGEEGFVKYKELKPDLVTLDITMPVLDGIQALSLIKKFDPEAKAVMITAAGQREKMIKAVKYGASEFITKPYEKEVVEKILGEILNQ
ncbi:MAG: response regulator [Lachnospiraceae bacterium]|nr:response regulator [Lachnospiraceae bacterium]